jgi:uncharacterized protein YndB with AHSA1/START domain
MNFEKVTIEATILAEPSKVWDYYTNPKHIVNWNFADPSWYCPKAENDLSLGGKYLARMEAKDGSFGFDFEAIYTNINEGIGFSFCLLDGRNVDFKIEENDSNSNVVIVFDAENENSIELQKQGWQAILNNFKNYTENN